MTIRDTNPPGNDNTTDPEVSFDPNASVSPVASAPPANNLPIASATAIPIVSATAVPEGTPSPLSDGSNIERITNSDGSLLVKVTNTTSNPDGSVIVRVEEYEVPANMANSVIQSMDMTGDAPSSLYLTKIEDHRLPPQGQPVGVVGDTSNTVILALLLLLRAYCSLLARRILQQVMSENQWGLAATQLNKVGRSKKLNITVIDPNDEWLGGWRDNFMR